MPSECRRIRRPVVPIQQIRKSFRRNRSTENSRSGGYLASKCWDQPGKKLAAASLPTTKTSDCQTARLKTRTALLEKGPRRGRLEKPDSKSRVCFAYPQICGMEAPLL